MKKLLPIAITALCSVLIIVSSCKKKDDNPVGNWTCHCSVTSSGTTSTVDLPISNTAKNTAKSACASAQTTYTSSGSSATCTLN